MIYSSCGHNWTITEFNVNCHSTDNDATRRPPPKDTDKTPPSAETVHLQGLSPAMTLTISHVIEHTGGILRSPSPPTPPRWYDLQLSNTTGMRNVRRSWRMEECMLNAIKMVVNMAIPWWCLNLPLICLSTVNVLIEAPWKRSKLLIRGRKNVYHVVRILGQLQLIASLWISVPYKLRSKYRPLPLATNISSLTPLSPSIHIVPLTTLLEDSSLGYVYKIPDSFLCQHENCTGVYRIGLLYNFHTLERWVWRNFCNAISVTKLRGAAPPISKVESHISDNSSYYAGIV